MGVPIVPALTDVYRLPPHLRWDSGREGFSPDTLARFAKRTDLDLTRPPQNNALL